MQVEHPLYALTKWEEADAVAWVALNNHDKLTMYPFKFKPLSPSEVRIKILYTSICHSDIMNIRQLWGKCNYPSCPGHEIVGQVTVVGKQVEKMQVGDYVGVSPMRFSDLTCEKCIKQDTNLCDKRIFLYKQHFGGYCTHIQLDSHWVFHIPKGMDLSLVAPLLCAGVTVYAPLKRYLKTAGKCAIIGIGGLGHLAIQFANKLGMRVSAFTTKLDNITGLKQLGAETVEHSTNYQQLAKNQGGYDIVLSTLFINDPKVYRLHQRLTKPGGTYIMIGMPESHVKYEIETEYLINNEIKIAGTIVGSIKSIQEMLQFSSKYNVRPINEYYEFQDFNQALHRAEKQNPRYRVVVNVSNWAKANNFDK